MPMTVEPTRMWTRDSFATHLESEVLPTAHARSEALPSERALAESFGVSRSLVREVLRGFEQRGLVEIVPGKGVYARDPGLAEAARAMREAFQAEHATPRHLIEARATLEHQSAALAAERATPEDIEALERALHDFDTADGLVAQAAADIAFHALLARASHNPVLATMFDSISSLVFETMLRSLADSGTTRRGAPLHHRILDAVRRGDATAAAAAMAEHIHIAETTYGRDLDERLDRLVADILHRAYGREVPLEQVVAGAIGTYTRGAAPGKGEPR
jgi:GntR family transcriptional repressor for pyruvate dehydrogenase complex